MNVHVLCTVFRFVSVLCQISQSGDRQKPQRDPSETSGPAPSMIHIRSPGEVAFRAKSHRGSVAASSPVRAQRLPWLHVTLVCHTQG